MNKEKIYIFDTTLRDGAQTEGVNFSIDDKNKIAKALSQLGVDYLEGGWPGANTTDTTFFNNPPKLSLSLLFGLDTLAIYAIVFSASGVTDTNLTFSISFFCIGS